LLVVGGSVEADRYFSLPVRDSSTGVNGWVDADHVVNVSLAIEPDGGGTCITDTAGFSPATVPGSIGPGDGRRVSPPTSAPHIAV
jgi:hypothetical protein